MESTLGACVKTLVLLLYFASLHHHAALGDDFNTMSVIDQHISFSFVPHIST